MPSLDPTELLSRVNRDVERSVLRARNGLRYVRGTSRPNVGVTPKDVVWRRDKAQLWRYRSTAVRYSPPLLLVHSLVSRSYILDLLPGNSMVEYLRDAGFDVFLLDWGTPDELDAENTLETYVHEYLPHAVAAVREVTGCEQLTIDGYCLGGLLVLLYAASHPEAPLRNLIAMATPVDFDEMGPMVALIQEGRLDSDHLTDESGNVPPDLLYTGFRMLAPTGQLVQYANLWQHLWNNEFMEGYQAMAQWTRDHIPFPGAAFRQIVDQWARRNALADGTMELDGRPVFLRDVRADVLNVMAEADTIVPLAAAEPLTRLVGDAARNEELRLPAGHIAFAAGRQAMTVTMPNLAAWIADHSDELAQPEEVG